MLLALKGEKNKNAKDSSIKENDFGHELVSYKNSIISYETSKYHKNRGKYEYIK